MGSPCYSSDSSGSCGSCCCWSATPRASPRALSPGCIGPSTGDSGFDTPSCSPRPRQCPPAPKARPAAAGPSALVTAAANRAACSYYPSPSPQMLRFRATPLQGPPSQAMRSAPPAQGTPWPVGVTAGGPPCLVQLMPPAGDPVGTFELPGAGQLTPSRQGPAPLQPLKQHHSWPDLGLTTHDLTTSHDQLLAFDDAAVDMDVDPVIACPAACQTPVQARQQLLLADLGLQLVPNQRPPSGGMPVAAGQLALPGNPAASWDQHTAAAVAPALHQLLWRTAGVGSHDTTGWRP